MNKAQTKLDKMGIQLESTLLYDMGYNRYLPVYVDQIDPNGTLWVVDSDGQDYEIGPEHYPNILSVEN